MAKKICIFQTYNETESFRMIKENYNKKTSNDEKTPLILMLIS